MNLVKKIILYMIGVIAIVFVAVIVACAYLVFVPDSQIYGYHYLSGDIVTSTEEYTDGLLTYENIEVESYGFDIMLYPQDEKLDKVMITFENNANGFTKEEITTFDYMYSYDSLTKTIKVKVDEPYSGLMFYSKAYIKIGVPETTVAKGVIVKSNGGKITIGEETPFGNLAPLPFETTSLTIENTSAAMTLQNFTTSSTGVLFITNTSGITDILSDVSSDVIIVSKIGSFNFGTETANTDIAGNLDIQARNAYVNVTGNIGGEMSQVGDSGLIKLGVIEGDVYINTENGEVEIGTVLGNLSIISKFNTIKIDNVGMTTNYIYSASINSDNGNILIENCYYDLEVNSTRGNITVLNAFWDTAITTTYGDVSINYNEDTTATKNINGVISAKTLSVTTTEGNITATNLKTVSTLSVASSSAAKITAEFLEINGNNIVNIGRRESTVKVPVSTYTFKVTTSNGGINILAGDAYKTSWLSAELNAETNVYEYSKDMLGGSTANDLTITSTAGKINVLTNEATVE